MVFVICYLLSENSVGSAVAGRFSTDLTKNL